MQQQAQQFLEEELRTEGDANVKEALRLLRMAVNEDVLLSTKQQHFLQMSLGCLRITGKNSIDYIQICAKVESLATYINTCKGTD